MSDLDASTEVEAGLTYRQISVEWQIKKIFDLSILDVVESPFFLLSDAKWFLRLNPNNREPNDSESYVSLYLLKKDSQSDVRVDFTCGIKKADGSVFKSFDIKQFVFTKEGQHTSGNRKFLLRADLLASREDVTPKDTLTVFCTAALADGGTVDATKVASPTPSAVGGFSFSNPALPPPSFFAAPATSSVRTVGTYRKNVLPRFETTPPATTSSNFSFGAPSSSSGKTGFSLNTPSTLAGFSFGTPATSVNSGFAPPRRETTGFAPPTNSTSFSFGASPASPCKRGVKEVCQQQEVERLRCPESVETLLENFKELFLSGRQGDITIRVQDKKFVAHKLILTARSSVFRAMFELDMAEKNSSDINIDDCDPDSFENFLLFLYYGKLDVVSAQNALCLYSTADKYDVIQLKKECSKCLSREISVDSVCDVVNLATLHDETELLNAATQFFTNNANIIFTTPKWFTFMVEHPTLANELLVKMSNKYIK